MTIETDHQQLVIETSVMNIVIVAARQRGGRNMLSSADYKVFQEMLAAMNRIQPDAAPAEEPKTEERDDDRGHAVDGEEFFKGEEQPVSRVSADRLPPPTLSRGS